MIPVLLRPHAGGASEVTAQGDTVDEVFRSLSERFPELSERLYNPDGTFRSFLRVFVQSNDIRSQLGMATPVPAGAQITILQPLAGG